MASIKPESPLTIEEVLCLWGYEVHYKDAKVCSLVPKDKKDDRENISISQDVGPKGLATEIIEKILFDARIDHIRYSTLLAKVQTQQQAQQDAQTKNL